MGSKILADYYNTLLSESSFIPAPCCGNFSPAGNCWILLPKLGGGYYWLYAQKNLFDIKIHDFFFCNDFMLNFDIPEGISITRYDSISGEELNPYRRLSAGNIQTFVGGKQNYKAIIHKRIPIHSVGIEIFPAYYEDYLKRQYPDEYFDLSAAFQCVDQAADFPAMSKLLFEIENYRGDGIAAALFYEAKVTEAIALVVDNQKKQAAKNAHPLSGEDTLAWFTAYLGPRVGSEAALAAVTAYQSDMLIAILPMYFPMVLFIGIHFVMLFAGKAHYPRWMLVFHPVAWNLLLVIIPDIAQTMQAPAATWMSVMSQSSTNSAIVIWCIAAGIYEKKRISNESIRL